MLRSIAAVVIGYVTIGILVSLADGLLGTAFPEAFTLADGVMPPAGIMALILAYDLAFATIGGLVTSAIARRRILLHVAWLAGLNVVFAVATYAFFNSQLPAPLPAWYYLAVGTLGVAGALLGGWIWLRWKGETPAEGAEGPEAAEDAEGAEDREAEEARDPIA